MKPPRPQTLVVLLQANIGHSRAAEVMGTGDWRRYPLATANFHVRPNPPQTDQVPVDCVLVLISARDPLSGQPH